MVNWDTYVGAHSCGRNSPTRALSFTISKIATSSRYYTKAYARREPEDGRPRDLRRVGHAVARVSLDKRRVRGDDTAVAARRDSSVGGGVKNDKRLYEQRQRALPFDG